MPTFANTTSGVQIYKQQDVFNQSEMHVANKAIVI